MDEPVGPNRSLMPGFARGVLENYPDGKKKIRNSAGLVEIIRDGVVSIPETVGTTFSGRESWKREYKPRL